MPEFQSQWKIKEVANLRNLKTMVGCQVMLNI